MPSKKSPQQDYEETMKKNEQRFKEYFDIKLNNAVLAFMEQHHGLLTPSDLQTLSKFKGDHGEHIAQAMWSLVYDQFSYALKSQLGC